MLHDYVMMINQNLGNKNSLLEEEVIHLKEDVIHLKEKDKLIQSQFDCQSN